MSGNSKTENEKA